MITKFFKRIYRFIDKYIVVPISRAVYYLSKKLKKQQGKIDKILNRPHFLIFLSLAIAIVFFVLIDSKKIRLVETDAEVIKGIPVVVKYNEEAYVVEGVPETVDITITGRKSELYIAKQLGVSEVLLDLSEYTASDTPYKVQFAYTKAVNYLSYKLDPSYAQVTIKNKESQVKEITYDLLNISALDSKLSVKSVTLNKQEVVVKGGSDTLEKIASVKALIDLKEQNFTDKGTYDIDNVVLVAYDANGNKLENVEIVPGTISATIVLDSYSKSVGLQIITEGSLVAGKSIASILINNTDYNNYSLTIYGDKEEIEDIDVLPVTINIDGLGNDSTKIFNTTIKKQTGVREMSTEKVTITVTFGEEQQKTIDTSKNITPINLGDGLIAQIPQDTKDITVQVKGVASVINDITTVDAYVDLAGKGVGEYEVDVLVNNDNPRVTYVASSKIKVIITKEN